MHQTDQLQHVIEAAWAARDTLTPDTLTPDTQGPLREAVNAALAMLDSGALRVAEPDQAAETGWRVNSWLKMAVLLSFRLEANRLIGQGSPAENNFAPAWDKVPLKTATWGAEQFAQAGFRAVPGSVVRSGAFIGAGVVLMPSFVNIGAHVGPNSMVDGWATVGSCAQIGANVHLSGGVGIGGVLEPLQANPVIIEDDVFIGARSEVVEGVIVRRGAVLSMGVYIGSGTKIVNRASGKVHIGEVPAFSVVVPGALPDPAGGPSLYCAVIVKTVDERTRAKTAINALLRD